MRYGLGALLAAVLILWAVEGTAVFEDVSEKTGLQFQHFIGATGSYFVPEIFGSGVAVLDYDGDGDLDVYFLQGTILDKTKSLKDSIFPPPKDHFPGNRLLRNALIPAGKLSFTDVTEHAGVAGNGGYAMGAAAGDYDNDGHPDLFVTNYGRDILYHNNGNGTFTDVTKDAFPSEESFGSSAAFVDYDQDGFLDLFVVRYNSFTVQASKKCSGYAGGRKYCGPGDYRPIPDKLYHNDGQGHFVDVTQKAGINAAYGNGLGVVCTDFNGDGRIDIFVANDKTPNQMWINKGDGTFQDNALISGTAFDDEGKEHAGMGVTAGDFDGDGDDDIFITNILGETHMLYLNRGKGMFQDVTKLYGLGHTTVPYTGFGTLWFDYDHDGRLDLFMANGEVRTVESLRGKPFPYDQKNQLFHNEGKTFRDVSAESGPVFGLSEVSRGAAFGDIDNDGDIDIVISNANGPARLFLNQIGNRDHWLEVRLEGVTVNRDAYGARVALLRKDQQPLWRRVAADGSYLSANDPRVHFGLGTDAGLKAAPPERILVVWPNGAKETWSIPKIDSLIRLREGTEGVNQAGIDSPGGSPVFSISGFSTISIRQGGFNLPGLNFNVADSVTWAKGKHVLKMGGELRTYSDYNEQVSNNSFGNFQFTGTFTGTAYADFLLGLPRRSIRLNPLVNRERTSKELGLFITDTFKATPKLTLDVGLRWDRFSATTYDDGLMLNWDPATGNVIVPQDAMDKISPLYPENITIVAGNVVPDPDGHNFAPRIGFAYRLNDKTVIRGGYGIFNEFLGSISRVSGGGPFAIAETYFNSITDGVPLFQMPNPFPASIVSASIPSQSVTGYPMETENGMIHEFNASVERQVGDLGFRLSYIGSRNRDMNYSLETNKPEPSLIPFSDDRRPYPQFVSTTLYRTNGATNYDSMSFEANRRVGWVTFDAHWTWAHGMDNMLNLENPYAPLVWNRDFLAKHRLVFNTMWELPFGRGNGTPTIFQALRI